MKKLTYSLVALVFVLGLSQCKKEQPLEPQGGQVRITLDVSGNGNNGSKVNVDPPHVTFEKDDVILVGYDGKYVGYLTHNGTNFTGSISASGDGSKKLYFFFAGNKVDVASLTAGTSTACTVDISNQSAELPVLSFSESNEYFNGSGSYTASLHNQCALVKFPLANASGSVLIGGMHTEATISFGDTPGIEPTATTGQIRLFSKTDTEKWAILLPQDAVASAAVAIGTQSGLTVDVPQITAGAYITGIATITNAASSVIDLSKVTTNITAQDGDILTNTLNPTSFSEFNAKVYIADGATVTLDNVFIGKNCMSISAGLTCLGDATIILKDGTSNTVKAVGMGITEDPGIFVPEGKTLTIQGNTGTLTVQSVYGPGLGAGDGATGGNIIINGGNITAISQEVGIGASNHGVCGNITITGGTVDATGNDGAGIGSGSNCTCGNITITSGVTQVTARSSNGPSIGNNKNGTCGTVTIGNTVGIVKADSYTYPQAAPAGPLDGKFSVSATEKVWFSPANLQATYNGSSWNWHFAEHEYDYIGNAVGNTLVSNTTPWISGTGTVDLFGWSTNTTYYGINSSTSSSVYSGDFVDWGTLSIGSDSPNTWRTLSRTEWNYLFKTRTDHDNKYGTATVAGSHGLILIPDNWSVPDGVVFNPGSRYDYGWDYNIYSSDEWEVMSASGAVFLPAAGYRESTIINNVETYGKYRASFTEGNQCGVFFGSTDSPYLGTTVGSMDYYCGYSVRLVRDAD
jgi:hypothetical protein